jgi:uncharacterized secreted protein with C-terminal beta-propeller domain
MNNVVLIILTIVLIGLLVGIQILNPPEISDKAKLKKFSSYDELKNFLKTNMEMSSYYGGIFASRTVTETSGPSPKALETTSSEDYSTTNIQVAGVDEADMIKNDGKHIYVISGNTVVILDAYPAENAKILSKIESNGTPYEIFINKDKLVVFEREEYFTSKETGISYPTYSKTSVKVYDVSNRTNPVLKRNVSVDGDYFDSRMIGDYVYVIVNQPVYYTEPIPLPTIQSNNKVRTVSAPEIYYFDFPDYSYTFTNVLAINTQNDNEDLLSKTFLVGYSQSMYVSLNNIYIVYTKRFSELDFYDRIVDQAIIPNVPWDIKNKINEIRNYNISKYEKMQEIGKVFEDYLETLNPEESANVMKNVQEKMEIVQREIAKEMEKTVVHKISVKNGQIEYKASGEVPGYVLNQFSMDEYNGYFRIATTTGHVSRGESETGNHIYVLDDGLNTVGKLEDLAPGERIYSARFIGDRCYLVTFKKIDPLFVIDLAEPTAPKVLGKLKIPGYSDYLHPYDENHIIGIGKETVEAEEESFAWYQGIKISLFDVSDVENPKEISKYNIGDRGTESYALQDHKAFLFSKSKNLLVIPILLAKINEEKYPGGVPPFAYGDYVWQGAYVFDVTLESGFVLKGRITHLENDTELIKSGYYFSSPYSVKRSLYIDGVLYTVSDKMIKMNDLDDLNEINKIELPYQTEEYPYYRGV